MSDASSPFQQRRGPFRRNAQAFTGWPHFLVQESPGTDSTCSFSKNEPMCCYPLMCIQEGSDIGVILEVWEPMGPGLVLYTGQYYFFGLDRGQYMLVYRFWSGLCWFCIVVSFFNKDVYDFSFLCSIPVHCFAVRIFTTYSRANVVRLSMSIQLFTHFCMVPLYWAIIEAAKQSLIPHYCSVCRTFLTLCHESLFCEYHGVPYAPCYS
jgi:hypothetical protein